jgi:glycyl-tRNA synthetase
MAEALAAQEKLNTTGSFELSTCAGNFSVTKDMVKFEAATKLVHENKYTPAVIEPSFGIGRIIYAVMEHSFYIREMDENRTVMAFKPIVAPYKVSLLPLSNSKNPEMIAVADDLNNALTNLAISCKLDLSSAAIGRRYARTDELGLPFAITIDFQTIDSTHALYNTVTLRERESMHQVRIHIKEVAKVIADLCNAKITYGEVSKLYPSAEGAAAVSEVRSCLS